MTIQLRFHPEEKYFPTDNNFRQEEPVIYKSEQTEPYVFYGKKYKSVLYEIYYQINGAIGFGKTLFPKSKLLGYHKIDIERIIILRDLTTNLPQHVYFSAHRDEGKWMPYNECSFTTFGDLIVYVAKFSHANYPSPGCWYRIYGLANDLCSPNGMNILPKIKNLNKTYTPPNREKKAKPCKRILFY